MRNYGRQCIDDDDINAVMKVLRSDFLTTGPHVEEFEKAFSRKIGAKHAIAVSSGTAALHLATLALKLGVGHRVVTSPNTFLASANCAAYTGAIPDFSDIDPVSRNICPQQLADNWLPDTKAVVAVDYAGQPCNMPEIAKIARSHGAFVIEDASHAVGSIFSHEGVEYHTGAHPWADITVFSFHPVKTITAGEGGMLTTEDDHLADQLRLLRNHGMTRDSEQYVSSDHALLERGPWYYEMQDLGYNYRITDMQCALAGSQLNKLSSFISKRAKCSSQYNERFQSADWIQIPRLANDSVHMKWNDISWHLYTLEVDFRKLGLSRTEVMDLLKAKGIGSQVLYIPVYLQPWYQKQFGYRAGKCPNSESFYQKALSLPLHPSLSAEDVDYIADVVLELK